MQCYSARDQSRRNAIRTICHHIRIEYYSKDHGNYDRATLAGCAVPMRVPSRLRGLSPPGWRRLLLGSSRSVQLIKMPGRGNPRVRPSGHQVDRRSISTDSGYAKAAPKSTRAGDLEPADLLPGHPDNPEHAVISQAIHADGQVSPQDHHRKVEPDGGSEAREDDPRCRRNGLRGSGPAQRAPNDRRRGRPPPPLWRSNAHPRQASHVSSEADRSRAWWTMGR